MVQHAVIHHDPCTVVCDALHVVICDAPHMAIDNGCHTPHAVVCSAHDTIQVRMPVLHIVRGMEATLWYSQLGVQYVYGYKKSTPYPYPSIPLSRNTQCYLHPGLSLVRQQAHSLWW